MSSRRPRRRGLAEEHEEHEEHPDERWMASYMDMVTVLMVLFMVLFAMSTVDQKKFDQLSNSLATGFGATEIGRVDTAEGIVVPADLVNEEVEEVEEVEEELTDLELAILEVDQLEKLRDQIIDNLEQRGLLHSVELIIDERGLTIRLVGLETFFGSNSIELVGASPQVLDSIAPVLVGSPYSVTVEGHADLRQSVYPYPTNWELSSGRATQVLRRLVELGGFTPGRISSVGFGSSRPLADGTSPEELAQNRRVDIVVHSDKPETVRSLIPSVIDKNLD